MARSKLIRTEADFSFTPQTMSKDQEFFNQAAAPGLEHWKKSFSKGFQSGQHDSEVGFEQRFQNWMLQGGMNRLMTENCFVKCLIGAFGGGALGLGFGAFLAPFDGRSGMRVRLLEAAHWRWRNHLTTHGIGERQHNDEGNCHCHTSLDCYKI
jgi:hypothetical protein